jgi:hypothetical protein
LIGSFYNVNSTCMEKISIDNALHHLLDPVLTVQVVSFRPFSQHSGYLQDCMSVISHQRGILMTLMMLGPGADTPNATLSNSSLANPPLYDISRYSRRIHERKINLRAPCSLTRSKFLKASTTNPLRLSPMTGTRFS